MQFAILIMRLSCNNFKIRKFVEENCKTLSVCMWFFRSIYEVFFLLKFVLFKFLNDYPKKKKKKLEPPLLLFCILFAPVEWATCLCSLVGCQHIYLNWKRGKVGLFWVEFSIVYYMIWSMVLIYFLNSQTGHGNLQDGWVMRTW